MLMETARIRLRSWQKDDLSDFCALNADPDVMRFFPATLARKDSDNLAASFQAGMLRHGFGIWVLELPGISSFAGVVGLNVPSFDNTLVEVSWRLHKLFWGHGFATEAAAVALEAGFSLFFSRIHMQRYSPTEHTFGKGDASTRHGAQSQG